MFISSSERNEIILFLKKAGLLFLMCVAGLYLLGAGYKKLDRNDYDCVKKFETIPNQIAVSNFGSSHGLYGFCYDDRTEYVCFNFGLVSQSLDYDFRILKQYESCLAEHGVMFLTVSWFSLFGPDEREKEDFLSLNRRYYKILDASNIKDFSFRYKLLVDVFPILGVADNVIYDLATGEERGRIVKDMWDWDMTDASLKEIETDAKGTCQRHMENKVDAKGKITFNQANVDALYGMIEICRKKNITPVLITTPYLKEYAEEAGAAYPQILDAFYAFMEQMKETGVAYEDFSRDLRFFEDRSLFFSVDHLNKKGALKLTEILWEAYVK